MSKSVDVADHIRTQSKIDVSYCTHVLEVLPRVQDVTFLVDIVGRGVGHPRTILLYGILYAEVILTNGRNDSAKKTCDKLKGKERCS